MSANNEDVPPQSSYPYIWSTTSNLSIDEFIAKYRPSMVQNDGSKPWLWVRGPELKLNHDESGEAAVLEAIESLNEYTAKIETIKNDTSIPSRSNKKTGVKGKKKVREQLQAEATEKLKEIATKHNYFNGKWLIFATPEKVDAIWAALAKSLISGPLASSSARVAKVSTSPSTEVPHYQHVICLYIPNVYDKEDVTAVMKILVRNHGFYLNGVKSDLYTLIGLDSKHASGIQSTIWKTSALTTDDETKELRDAYFAEMEATKGDKTNAEEASIGKAKEHGDSDKKSKAKPRLKKVQDDPFASDDDQNKEQETHQKPEPQVKKPGTRLKRQQTSDSESSQGTAKKAKSRK